MKKIVILIISIFLITLLTSCNNNSSNAEPKMVDVKLTVSPKVGKINEPMTLEARVTQGNEKVNDADEVLFEIWRSKDENHQKYKIKNPKNGIYKLEKSFEQEGTYYIVSHVTARGMHNMPKKEFVVGTPSEREDPNEEKPMEGMNMDKQGH